jgi:hypothetical protein
MRALRRLPARLRNARGSSLVELALVAPLFFLIIMWAQTLVDTATLRLKAQEASRFAAWEFTALRTAPEIERDAQSYYSDLRRNNIRNDKATLTYFDANVTLQSNPNLSAPLRGNISPPSQGGLLGGILRFITNIISGVLESGLRRMDVQQNGRAQAGVTFSVQNKLFPFTPQSEVGNVEIALTDNRVRQLQFRDQVTLTYDTMKAWPNPYARAGSRDPGASPMDSYPVVEQQTSRTLEKIAFFGFSRNGFSRFFETVFSWLGVPSPFPQRPRTWEERDKGAIFMPPADPVGAFYAPGAGRPTQRLGEYLSTSTINNIQSPNPGVDRSRHGIPYSVNTQYWTNRGGFSRAAGPPSFRRNDYTRSYACRGYFYMGNTAGETARMPRRCR